jgi:hypothetical protein
MRFLPEKVENRREFFRAGGRYGLLALLTGLGAMMGRPGRPASQRCINGGICTDCGAFVACELPAALSAKLAKRGDV